MAKNRSKTELLSEKEQAIKQLIGPKLQCLYHTEAEVYSEENVSMGLFAKGILCLVQEYSKFFFRLYDINEKICVWEYNLVKENKYNEVVTTFHRLFYNEESKFAFEFTDANDASDMASKVLYVLENLPVNGNKATGTPHEFVSEELIERIAERVIESLLPIIDEKIKNAIENNNVPGKPNLPPGKPNLPAKVFQIPTFMTKKFFKATTPSSTDHIPSTSMTDISVPPPVMVSQINSTSLESNESKPFVGMPTNLMEDIRRGVQLKKTKKPEEDDNPMRKVMLGRRKKVAIYS